MGVVNQTLNEETKHWEALYYKENALVGLLKSKINSLEAEVEYLRSELAYNKKYGEKQND